MLKPVIEFVIFKNVKILLALLKVIFVRQILLPASDYFRAKFFTKKTQKNLKKNLKPVIEFFVISALVRFLRTFSLCVVSENAHVKNAHVKKRTSPKSVHVKKLTKFECRLNRIPEADFQNRGRAVLVCTFRLSVNAF